MIPEVCFSQRHVLNGRKGKQKKKQEKKNRRDLRGAFHIILRMLTRGTRLDL